MLLSEPWCFTPSQIADLTPWQVEHCYLRPARERAERMESGDKPKRKGHDWNGLPDKGEFVASMHESCGKTPEHWAAVWEQMRAKREEEGYG